VKFKKKEGEPPRLRQWRLENQPTPQVLSYENMPGDVRSELRERLLAEQGFLCAYTMLRIKNTVRGHIEHILPRSRVPERAIDYNNMVYCHPGEDSPRCSYGAHAKDGALPNPGIFVSPLDPNCESRFAYRLTGEIVARPATDTAAVRSIETLNLKGDTLKNMRRAAILQLPIFRHAPGRLSASEARKRASALLRTDGRGMFAPFAPALHQFIAAYAKRKEVRELARSGAQRLKRER